MGQPNSKLLTKLEIAENWAISIFVGCTIATQFRSGQQGDGLDVGLPEIIISAWAVCKMIHYFPKLGSRWNLPVIFYFFTLFSFGAIATLNGYTTNRFFPGAQRDILALLANSTITIALILSMGSRFRALHLLTCLGLVLGSLNLLSIIFSQLGISIGGSQFYDATSHRFYGFTANPNQLALGSVVSIGAISCGLEASSGFGRKTLMSLLLMASFWAGYLSSSDAFKVSVFAFLLLVFGQISIRAIRLRNIKFLIGVALTSLFAAGFSLVLLFSTGQGAIFRTIVAGIYYGDDDHGSVRILLWRNGSKAFLESNMLGFGPGSFSGITGPFERMESHNSFIDLGTNIGIGGATLIGFVMLLTLRRSHSVSVLLFSFVGMLIAFMMFHHVLRHFIFWVSFVSVFIIARPYKSLISPLANRKSTESGESGGAEIAMRKLSEY